MVGMVTLQQKTTKSSEKLHIRGKKACDEDMTACRSGPHYTAGSGYIRIVKFFSNGMSTKKKKKKVISEQAGVMCIITVWQGRVQ